MVQEEDVFVTVSDMWEFLPHDVLETKRFPGLQCLTNLSAVLEQKCAGLHWIRC